MSTNRFARPRRTARRKAEPQPNLEFDPVVMRERADGWLPDRQVEFIEALAETGCVAEACARVGMSTASAYTLRRRPDAYRFRVAWEAAVAHAIRRLSDAAMSRALHGVSRPVFYKGEQVGERRYYDERLTQFLLRHNDPVHYGRWKDRGEWVQPDGAQAFVLNRAVNALHQEAWHRAMGYPPPKTVHVVEQVEDDDDDDPLFVQLMAKTGRNPDGSPIPGWVAPGTAADGQIEAT